MARLPLVFAATRFFKNGKQPVANAELSLLRGPRPPADRQDAHGGRGGGVRGGHGARRPTRRPARISSPPDWPRRGGRTCSASSPRRCATATARPAGGDTITDQEDVTSAVARCVARVPVWAAHAHRAASGTGKRPRRPRRHHRHLRPPEGTVVRAAVREIADLGCPDVGWDGVCAVRLRVTSHVPNPRSQIALRRHPHRLRPGDRRRLRGPRRPRRAGIFRRRTSTTGSRTPASCRTNRRRSATPC